MTALALSSVAATVTATEMETVPHACAEDGYILHRTGAPPIVSPWPGGSIPTRGILWGDATHPAGILCSSLWTQVDIMALLRSREASLHISAVGSTRPDPCSDFDERRRHYTVDPLTSRIEHLGYRVHLEPLPTATA